MNSSQSKSVEPQENSSETAATESTEHAAKQSKAYTPKKGHATPKRKEAQSHSGSFESRFTPAESLGESRKRRKELKASMTNAEWKAYKAEQKEARKQRQRAAQRGMDSGDERYLLPRDKGPERAFVRDLVDSKRHLNSYVMPFAIGLLLVMMVSTSYPSISNIVSIVAMLIMLVFFAEAVMLGRAASRAVREKFPNTTENGYAIGFYAFGRASQPRRWRTPKPKVEIGDTVK